MKLDKTIFLFAVISILSINIFSCITCKHDYEIVETVPATCEQLGYETLKCKNCNKKITNAILSGGHDFLDLEIIEEATCIKEGLKIQRCQDCGYEVEIIYLSDKHEFDVTHFEATCDSEEYNLKKCSICEKEEREILSNSLGHSYSDWEIIVDAEPLKEGLMAKTCSVCGNKEEKVIPSTIHLNLDVLTTKVDIASNNECNSFDEAQLYFDAAIFRYITSFKLECNFDYGKEQNLFDTLVNNCSTKVNFHVTMKKASTFSNNVFMFTLEYSDMASKKAADEPAYEQYMSVNYQPYVSNRSSDYNDFRLYKNTTNACDVDYTDQLVYVLERGIIPNVKSGSMVSNVYEKIKEVLRNIIDDRMSDYEKIKAIHDYLILNVTYDNDLLNLAYQNVEDINSYNGFYLEGVFIDKLAVCDGISKAFSVMCNLEGIPCVSVTGAQLENPNGLGHAWNKVFLDGKWYIVDVTSDGTIINQSYEILSYEYFLISNDSYSKKYQEHEFTELICDNNYDAYKLINVSDSNNLYDCYIESFEELVMMIKCFELSNPNKTTIQFYVAFNFGTSIVDEIQSAYAVLRISASFSHIASGNIITIIK